MPRTNVGIPLAQLDIADELRDLYGGMMCLADIMRELGYKDRKTAQRWASDVPAYETNGLKRWRVGDVAKKIYQNRVRVS